MSFYRSILATVAALLIVTPVFADDSSNGMDNSQPTSAMQSANDNAVNLNSASAKELMKVKGITSSKAKAIVAYRKKHGNFNSVDDLAKVKGFTSLKSSKMKAITDQLTVD